MTAAPALSLTEIPQTDPAKSRGWLAYGTHGLQAEAVDLTTMARAVGTPFYCYSSGALQRAYSRLEHEVAPLGVSICFAVKANSNIAVLAEFARLGCGMDIVSAGEMERALAAGVPPGRIIFSGVGKTRAEITRALEVGLHQINVESEAELAVVAEVAVAMGVSAPVALRVNPDVDAGTHAKITTARKDSKFGIAIDAVPEVYARAAATPGLNPLGLAVHIGSQVIDLVPFRKAWAALADLTRDLRAQGLAVSRLDLGGGLGVGATAEDGPDLAEYARIIAATVGDLGCAVNIEPGRWLAAHAGVLVTEVLYLKQAGATEIAVVDAAMNDLMRPALYDAHHPVLPVQPAQGDLAATCRIVGPVCESSDDFGSHAGLGTLRAGDLLVFDQAGAYGAVMSSSYNSRPLVPEVMVQGDRFRIIRQRPAIADLLALEVPGDWQSPSA